MAIHIWNGSAWKAVNRDDESSGGGTFGGLVVWNGSGWVWADNAKVWNGSAWKGFLDNVMLSDYYVWTLSTPVGSEQAIYNVSPNGGAYGNYSLINMWNQNSDNSGQYEIFATQVIGDPIYGASMNTWLNLSTNREWYFAPIGGQGTAIMEVEIRNAITLESLTTASITLAVTPEYIPN